MFAFSARQIVDLTASRSERACVFPSHAEQDYLSDIAKIKADATTVRAPILSHLVPHNVALVLETPRTHDFKSFGKECIGNPEIKMRGISGSYRYGQSLDLVQCHRSIAIQSLMLRCNLASTVLKLPGRVGQDCLELSPS